MKTGEKAILGAIAVFAVVAGAFKWWQTVDQGVDTQGIPFYSDAPAALASQASELFRKYDCRSCHTLWGIRDMMQSVPAPSLDGIGSLRSHQWLTEYMAAENPQSILPSRLKQQYRMPSFAAIPAEDRRVMVDYLASMKVENWYLEEVKKSHFEKLTGEEYRP